MEPTNVPLYYRHPYSSYRFESSSTDPQFYPTVVAGAFPPSTSDDAFDDENQIPSIDDFQAIIDDYLSNLSPKKRDKALVDQHRYYMIQQVLKDPRNTAISTAQFRFWVKKMFRLQPGPNDVVYHDNKPVAIKESIYDILVKAHREAHHGGRDKTSALVRKRYSWIPKELVARFVRHCPYCITRRNSGISPSLATSPNSSAPQTRYSNRSSFCFESGSSMVYTPPAMKEDVSDLSSGHASSDVSHEVSPNYVAMSPKEPSYPPTTMHPTGKDDDNNQLFYGCHYDHSFQPAFQIPTFYSMQQQPQHEEAYPQILHSTTTIHPLRQHQITTHSYPQTPLFYPQSHGQPQQYSSNDYQDYYGPLATASTYYCNGLGITHHYQENPSLSSSETTTIHTTSSTPNAATVPLAGNITAHSMNSSVSTANRPSITEEVAAEVAVTAAFMQSAANADLLSHNNATTTHDPPPSSTSFHMTNTTTTTTPSTAMPSTSTTFPFYNNEVSSRYRFPLEATGVSNDLCINTA